MKFIFRKKSKEKAISNFAFLAFSLLLSSLISISAMATEKIFLIDGKKVSFFESADQKILVTKDCHFALKKCKAYRALEKARFPTTKAYGGINPGAAICLAFKQEVVIGTDINRNQNSFCKFKDGSIVDNGSIHYAAIQNSKN